MMKKFIFAILTVLVISPACSDKFLDIDLGADFKGRWQMYERCLSNACLPPAGGAEVIIEFRESSYVEKQDGQVIGAGTFTIAQVQNGDGNGETAYQLVVDGNPWLMTVTETTLEINLNLSLRRYNKLD